MKALYTLIVPALLIGCSNLKSMPESPADLPAPEAAKTAPADKPKIVLPVHVDALPPLSTTDSTKSTSTLSTPPKAEPKTIVDLELFFPFKILKVGSRGKAVLELEKQLAKLDYAVGKVDGRYDKQTRQGVLAFQKYSELKRTGTYTEETEQALQTATPPEGSHPELGFPRIEVDVTRQVLLFFDDKKLKSVIAVSTGSDRKYCETSKKSGKKMCGVALTPRGTFHVQRKIPGWRESDLGKLYNPLYFSGGFAIHGAPSVPEYNASHGCIRISVATSEWFYSTVKTGTPVIIFD